jgi:hypothetical protein
MFLPPGYYLAGQSTKEQQYKNKRKAVIFYEVAHIAFSGPIQKRYHGS